MPLTTPPPVGLGQLGAGGRISTIAMTTSPSSAVQWWANAGAVSRTCSDLPMALVLGDVAAIPVPMAIVDVVMRW